LQAVGCSPCRNFIEAGRHSLLESISIRRVAKAINLSVISVGMRKELMAFYKLQNVGNIQEEEYGPKD
jgi:hypothetical protein